MRLEISRSLADRLRSEAIAAPGQEVCGLLFGTADRIEAASACTNVSPRPQSSFELDPIALLAAHKAMRTGGPRLIGHYHSHPSGVLEPSRRDADAATPDGMIWIVLAGNMLAAWRAGQLGLHGRFVAVELATCG